MRAELLERYHGAPASDDEGRALALHGSQGLRPGRVDGERRDRDRVRRRRCSSSTSPGVAHVGEAGIEIERAPEGIRFEPLTDDHELLDSLVGWDEKFAAHNAAMWQHGLLVHVPRGVVLEKPLYVRVANSVEGGSLFWRLLVVAEPESRFTLIEEYASASPELCGVLERRRRDLRRAGREGRVRLRAEPLARDVALRVAPRARRARRGARLGRRRLRLGEGQDPDPERPRRARARPRASPAPTSPTGRSTSTTTRSRSTSRRTRRRTSRSRARCATPHARSGAG